MIDLAIIIVNFNTKKLTKKCLDSIFKQKWAVKYEVWVVDNASNDGSFQSLRQNFSQIRVIKSQTNLGFAGGNNLALRKAKARYYLLLNSDTEVKPNSLDQLVDFADQNGYGITSCRLINPNGTFQPNSGYLPKFFPMFFWMSGIDDLLRKIIRLPSYQARDKAYYQSNRSVGWVGGTAMLISDKVIKRIGFLDSKIFMYGEDVEYCYRAQIAGFTIGWTNQAEIVHLGGGSLKTPQYNQWLGEFKGLLYIYRKYNGLLSAFLLRLLISVFVIVRMIAFALIGKFGYSKTYARILIKI